MNKTLLIFAILAVLTSCAGQYNVQGTSSVSSLDGSKLYLKAVKNNELKNIDSCDVVHGQFHFCGVLDTVRMANLFMDDESLLPVVLEKGDIEIKIDNASQSVGGTPLNDKLYVFINKHKQLENQLVELSHKQSQMLLDGLDEMTINEKIKQEGDRIAAEEDKLVTTFIVDNFDNVLGPGVFMMMTSGFQIPILNPQIEDIMSKATDKFKNDPYVKEYIQAATENMAKMQGMDPSGQPLPTQAPPQAPMSVQGNNTPTPMMGEANAMQNGAVPSSTMGETKPVAPTTSNE